MFPQEQRTVSCTKTSRTARWLRKVLPCDKSARVEVSDNRIQDFDTSKSDLDRCHSRLYRSGSFISNPFSIGFHRLKCSNHSRHVKVNLHFVLRDQDTLQNDASKEGSSLCRNPNRITAEKIGSLGHKYSSLRQLYLYVGNYVLKKLF